MMVSATNDGMCRYKFIKPIKLLISLYYNNVISSFTSLNATDISNIMHYKATNYFH